MEKSELTQEEVDVFAEPDRPAPAVEPRDFRQPRRLSPVQVELLKRRIFSSLASIEDTLRSWLRKPHRLKLVELGEINSELALRGLSEPLTVLSFFVGDQQGWIVWDPPAAMAALEVILGADEVEGEIEPRRLAATESGLLRDFLRLIAGECAGIFGLEASSYRVSQTEEELDASQVATPNADPQRTFIHLAFHGPGGESTLRIYLPGVQPPETGAAKRESDGSTEVPQHLDAVPIQLEALLGCVDVPLTELLKIEVGDVLPLGIRAGSPVIVKIEGRACAHADWGNNDGQLVLRLQDFDLQDEA